jgi:hypothetical protein
MIPRDYRHGKVMSSNMKVNTQAKYSASMPQKGQPHCRQIQELVLWTGDHTHNPEIVGGVSSMVLEHSIAHKNNDAYTKYTSGAADEGPLDHKAIPANV